MTRDPYECFRCGATYPSRVPYCAGCFMDGTIVPAIAKKSEPDHGEQEPPFVAFTSKKMVQRHAGARLIDLPACPGVKLCEGAFVLLYGPPGAGKSTLALKLLDSIPTDGGSLLAYVAEEGDALTVANRIELLGIQRDDLFTVVQASVRQLTDFAREQRARALLVDSLDVASFQPDQTRELVQRLGMLALFGVLQVNKKGEMAGVKEWDHAADITIRVDPGSWTLEKSRYQPRPYPSGTFSLPKENP